jgi:formamidopyrimidine-DNA glycosylase
MVRGIRSAVEGRILTRVGRCRCPRKPILVQPSMRSISSRSRGRRFVSVYRIAKRVLLELDSGDTFAIEPRMTGLMLITDPPTREHLRVGWELVNPVSGEISHLWFWDRRGLGTVRLLTRAELQSRLGPPLLGPDALAIAPDSWSEALQRTGRHIKVALLDQQLVSGIGNLYASEILHLSAISPRVPAKAISSARRLRLYNAMREVLQTAIEYEGSTLGDGTYRNALNQSGSYQNRHQVYAREGEPCRTCRRSTIRRIVQAQRSTYYCPRCQSR